MGKEKINLGIDGVTGQNIEDGDIDEMNTGTNVNAEVNEIEPEAEISDDLPEGITKTEGEVSPEPASGSDPDVERLKQLGLYRPGMIENFEDAAKSYTELEKKLRDRPLETRKPREEPQVSDKQVIDDLREQFDTDPLSVITRISNAVASNNAQDIQDIKEGLFHLSHPEASKHSEAMTDIQSRYPGMDMSDAFAMAQGRDIDNLNSNLTEQANVTAQKRQIAKQVALREKPAGVRTEPQDLDKALQAAVAGKTGHEAVMAMQVVLDKHDKGLRE